MPSGMTSTTYKDLVYTHGLLSFKKGTGRYEFVTMGPPTVKPVRTIRNLAADIDGVTTDIALADVIDENNIEITLTVVNMSVDTFKAMHPGATVVTTAGPPAVNTITPADASALFASTAYLEEVEVAFRKGKDGSVIYMLPLALVTDWSMSAPNKNKGQVQLTIRGRLDLTGVGATTDDPTYTLEITEPTA